MGRGNVTTRSKPEGLGIRKVRIFGRNRDAVCRILLVTAPLAVDSVPEKNAFRVKDSSEEGDGNIHVVLLTVFMRLSLHFTSYAGWQKSYPGHEETCRSEAPKQQILWNTEMLAYTLYTADDVGRVTTWDLKPLLLNLAQM